MKKPANLSYAIHPMLAERWSPRAFDGRSLSATEVHQLLEAARWAPSCFNAQPWRYLCATRDDGAAFEKLLGWLAEGNRPWAEQAGALLIGCVQQHFAHNGEPNAWAEHDMGLANAQLVLQAEHMGLRVHMMAGFDPKAAASEGAVPEGFKPLVALAVGHQAPQAALPSDPLKEKEAAPRARQPHAAFAFGASFGKPYRSAPNTQGIWQFWFGELNDDGLADATLAERWWKPDANFDAEVREKLGGLRQAALRGDLSDWQASAEGALGLLILLDQVSRNAHRGTPEMYAGDSAALTIATEALKAGYYRSLPVHPAAFLFMPCIHAESLTAQDFGLTHMRAWRDGLPEGPQRQEAGHFLRHAQEHRDDIARFGRFPYRNGVLGRENTAEETTFLESRKS